MNMQLNNTCFRLALRPFLILAVVMTTSISIVGSVCGQAQEDPVAETSAINQRLSQLESELGKYKDSAPEAANLMLQLVDEYYRHGRGLGLVRICQRFTQVHFNHPKHREMMLKLIDGQQVLSRNNELIVACRQHLELYGASGEAAAIEIRLADALEQTTDREGAAKAAEVVWKRYGNSVIGKKYVERAVYIYQSLPGNELQTQAAVLSEEAMEKIPAKDFARAMGLNAVYLYSRLSQRVESNRVINRMFQRGLAGDSVQQRASYLQMASNYEQLQQYTNAASMYQRARQIRDDADTFYKQAMVVYSSKTNPGQTEGLLNQFKQKYPADERKWILQQYVAFQYYGAMNNAKALQLIRDGLQGDAVTHNAGAVFVTLNGSEPAKLQDTERVIRDAINKSKNPASRAKLYRILAFGIYQGEAFNQNRALQLCREFLSRYPDGGGDTTYMIDYLFKNSVDDNSFRNDVRMVLASRKKFLQHSGLVSYPAAWVQANRSHKDYKARSQILKQELATADNDPLVKLWAQSGGNTKNAAAIRQQLLESGHFNAMNNDMAVRKLTEQTSYYRSYAPTADRGLGNKYYALWIRRFPNDLKVAADYLYMATTYGTPEDCRSALQHMLRKDPQNATSDTFNRMLTCAARNEDANLGRQAYNWVRREEQQHGVQASSLTAMGDILTELKLADLAKERYQTGASLPVLTSDGKQCIDRLAALEEDPAKRQQVYEAALRKVSDQFGSLMHNIISLRLAPEEGKTIDWNAVLTLLEQTRDRDLDRPFTSCGLDVNTCVGYLSTLRGSENLEPAQIRQYMERFVKLDLPLVSSVAQLLILNDDEVAKPEQMAILLMYQKATYNCGETSQGFDQLTQFAKSAAANQQHVEATTIGTGILANFASVDEARRKAVRDLVSRSYTQIGEVGLTIDEDSPIAPLLQAALYLRLGDQELAFDLYSENVDLFSEHRELMPVDLVEFVVERLIAAGGDENFDYVEDLVRTWLVKNSESEEVGDGVKATMQLLLAENYFKARRFDIARSEYTTVVNRYPESEQALEAQFGIGESFMEQKVFDQAQQVFDKLANSNETLIVVRAEFLRGVLSFRRGDRDEARDIFRSVLERVPNVELANQTLYNLAEIYRVEERYIDQLNLLRTIGRLGRQSKSRHNPGTALSIVVHDSDLGISRGHNRIPVTVTTTGGDSEMVYLISTGAGKGLFRGDLETVLGDVTADDGYLQLTGNDVIRCDYPEEFRAEFKSVPLSDVDIRIASNADFEIASSIDGENEETSFSDELITQQEGAGDERLSQSRPSNQVKPGNPLYIQVEDPDRDLSGEIDNLVVKLVTDSGDAVQVEIRETSPHSGMFEGTVDTSELPAGALATDSAIDHSPLMAIDKDPKTFWLSQPDGAAPKDLTVDMKDLYGISRVNVGSPSSDNNHPVRMDLLGSYDGEFWFRLSSFPRRNQVGELIDTISEVQQLVVMGDHRSYREWSQVLALAANKSDEFTPVENELVIQEEIGEDEKAAARSVLWSGLFNMDRSAAVRFRIQGNTTAVSVDGILELPVAAGTRTVDVWLEKGRHEIQAFSAFVNQEQGAKLEYAIASVDTQQVLLQPMRTEQFIKAVNDVELIQTPKVFKRFEVATAQISKTTETFAVVEKAELMVTQNWNALEDTLSISLDGTRAGVYELWLDYSRSGSGAQIQLTLDNQVLDHSLVNTGSYDSYQSVFIGHVMIEASGKKQLLFTPVTVTSNLMELKGVELRPIDRDAVVKNGDSWEFRFPEREIRYTKVVVNEYVGDAVAISQIEVGNADNGETQIPTDSDILSLASNDVLEIAAGDRVVATYTDEYTLNELNTAQLLTRELTATYHNGEVNAISYSLSASGTGGVNAQRKELMRVDPGERIVVEVVDYDEDRSNDIDTITVDVVVNDGDPIQLDATETGPNTGIFTREIDTTSTDAEGKLTVKNGDVVYLRYLDSQNTFPGHTVPRERMVFVNEPTDARVRIIPSLAQRTSSTTPASVQYLPESENQDSAAVAFDAPLLVEVIDPDMAKDTGSTVTVALVTTGGSVVFVDCVISNVHSNLPQSVTDNEALVAGRFVGQVIMQLGGKESPNIIPLTSEMPRGLIGRVHEGKEEMELLPGLVAMVLNLTGEDVISMRYKDEITTNGESPVLQYDGRLVSTGNLQITDREYEEDVQLLHVGEKIFLKVNDPDQDVSDERDSILVTVTTELGEAETVSLFETTVHSGEFTGAFDLEAKEKPTVNNITPEASQIETYFGDQVTVAYTDGKSAESTEALELTQSLPVVVGTDGLVIAFSKAFENEELAVETKFRIAESYFELFKSHKELGRDEEQTVDLEAGRRILQEVMEDYPDPKYVPRISYLLGQFSQELEQWSQAISAYEVILQQYGDHTLAPDAQYKLAQCLEYSGDFDEALEAYVTLAATYPKSPLIASVMIRISDHFYKSEQFEIAAQVGEKFLEKFEGHEHAQRMAFRIGQAFYKSEDYQEAGDSFDRFMKLFPEDELSADALFWSGEAYRMANNNQLAFRRYNRCRWDFPASEAAKFARGRLALPEMLNQFEAEANSIDNDN
jgi:TolA-binding protein